MTNFKYTVSFMVSIFSLLLTAMQQALIQPRVQQDALPLQQNRLLENLSGENRLKCISYIHSLHCNDF